MWGEISCDLHERYGIDVSDTALMQARSWRWLMMRVEGLLQVRSRMLWTLFSEDDRSKINERLMRGGHPLPWG